MYRYSYFKVAGHGHHVVFGRTGPAQQQLVLAADPTAVQGGQRGGADAEAVVVVMMVMAAVAVAPGASLVQHADRAVLADPVRHLVRVDPEGELARQQLEDLLVAQSDPVRRLPDDGVHFVVDPDTPVPGAFARFVREPVVLIVLCWKQGNIYIKK
ncbi:hypothetical protein chiPu_0013693 [Chiloscyllium punctatum]|uniref:Uncharacterized protein n=1 Tax=Chiloscyllium punctatum TaxID=137246 RepID=A0A401SXU7_CHIPU|nr:hypothetical protein [Chiloscyllium punctatum]